jgi:hypothetical protein
MKKLLGSVVLAVIAIGTLAVMLPMPATNACLHCTAIRCPVCTRLGGGSCFKCPGCVPIPGCTP